MKAHSGSKWVTGMSHLWILWAEKLSLQSFNLTSSLELAIV